jgi:hypothetical protein
VRGVTLWAEMLPNANVHHAIDVSLDGATFRTVVDINQYMANGEQYSIDFGAPVPARFVRIRSLGSPSWIAWGEVGVFVCR